MSPNCDHPPWVLLTNDDGVDSPILVPLVQQLAKFAPVRAVVPDGERSWAAKTMSRFGQLRVSQQHRNGCSIWAVDGSPADCANLGIHSLFASKPALVVSGINMGLNAGLAYLLSSGTVGAAIEGVLSGIPAAAFSLELKPEVYKRWRQHRHLEDFEHVWLNTASVSAEIAGEVLLAGLPQQASLLSVNMPPQTTVGTPRRFSSVTPTAYGSFFGPDSLDTEDDSQNFVCNLADLEVTSPSPDGDLATLARGEVALTPIRFSLDAPLTAADRRRFERRADS